MAPNLSDPPPRYSPYESSRSPTVSPASRQYSSTSTCETTPLMGKKAERSKTWSITPIALIIVGFVILLIVFSILWGPYLGIAYDRQKWDQELAKNRLDEQLRMTEWERRFQLMQEEWNKKQEAERLREEQWQRDEEGRQRLGLYWSKPEPNQHCAAYNMRDYSARLLNTVPYNYNWLQPCEEIPIVIHGRTIHTNRCEIKQDDSGEVYGHWRVDFDEPLCTPYWDQFKDKGCTASGSHKRRIEAHLENIHGGEDSEKMCASTPHDFYGNHFEHPDSCAYWGKYGYFGIWIIDDPDC